VFLLCCTWSRTFPFYTYVPFCPEASEVESLPSRWELGSSSFTISAFVYLVLQECYFHEVH